jgi:hypothetical protein
MANDDATPSELRDQKTERFPGLPKRNPGLELANAFSVVCRTLSFPATSKLSIGSGATALGCVKSLS